MTRLRVLAGPSLTTLVDISNDVNLGSARDIVSEAFQGSLAVYIKGFPNRNNQPKNSEFFEREDRQEITWSIQVQGRFLQSHSANDILFGNIFERRLKLPWGTSAALGFMKYIDPTLEHDLTSEHKPWALSPLISTMPYFSHSRISSRFDLPVFPPPVSITDDVSQLGQALVPDATPDHEDSVDQLMKLHTPLDRRAHFHYQAARDQISFGPNDLITTDFCYGFLEFSPELAIKIPGGLSFNIARYWDGQPVRFVCCERPKYVPGTEAQDPWGKIFWCVSIELDEEVPVNAPEDDVD